MAFLLRYLPAVLFAGSFAICAPILSLGLRAATPMPEMVVLSDKLDVWRADAPKYNTVFIGTSRTFYHIDPAAVEAAAAANGCPDMRAFNFGVFGMTGAELDWTTGEILSASGAALRTLVLEDPLPQPRAMDEATNERARWFHGPDYWDGAVDNIRSYPESRSKRLFRTGIFLYGVAFDLSGVGLGAALVFPPVSTEAFEPPDVSRRGFEPLGSVLTENIIARREEFVSNPEGFVSALKRYGAASDEPVAERAAYIAERLRSIEARGVNAALYVSPDLGELDRTPRVGGALSALDPSLDVYNYNQPDQYADLFERDVWHDFSHLLPVGAERLSVHLGTDICDSWKRDAGETNDAVR